MSTIEKRLAALEAMRRPPGVVWTIPVDIVEWRGDDGTFGRVVAHIPARPLEPGEPFDYERCIDELVAAMAYDDDDAEL